METIGLTTREVSQRLKQFGYNEIVEKKEYRALKIIVSQFASFLILILIIAGGISIFLGETVDGIAILAIVVINAIIGFIQEYKAENAVQALKKMVVPTAVVLRDGNEKQIPIKEIVPDDTIILSEGEKIPADLEIIEAFSLCVDESMLTGESVPVNKAVTSGREGKLYKGTIITTGRARARTISTGINTEFGKIINLISKEDKSRSPLTIQLDSLGKQVGIAILILISILFVLGMVRGIHPLEMLMVAVALGVSAIPEGMPIIVTLTLAMGVQTLARKKAIVRKMNSIETLGATTIICSDKTGTLTMNEMTVKKVFTNFNEIQIPGHGYETNEKVSLTSPEAKKLLEVCENCNNSFFGKNMIGDPTEIALKVLAAKADYIKPYKELDENVFTSERKMMSTLNKVGSKKEIMAKGAFEEIIKRCTKIMRNGKITKLTPEDRKKLTEINTKYAKEALRVLAFAYKPFTSKFDEKNLVFIGLTGMLDPPRKSVKNSIAIAQKAGIKVRIITGDNAITARAIGEKIGLNVSQVATGEDIDKLSDAKLKQLIYKTEIFARTKPEHKHRIVSILQKNGEVVAVTGDGVNDAPALKHADVGVAMGIKGTEATKEVADIVLKDDNFTTIVNTIQEGRRIYHNILAFIKYMLSANFITIIIVGILTTLNFPLPILPLQILWLNIATDALPALALGQSPPHKDIMEEKPHPKHEHIFRKFLGFIIIAAVYQTIANLIIFFYGYNIDIQHARTLVFTQTVMFELLFVFVCKDEKSITFNSFLSNKSLIGAVGISFILQLVMVYAPPMQHVFETVPLTPLEWALIIPLSATAFLIPRSTKIAKKIFSH